MYGCNEEDLVIFHGPSASWGLEKLVEQMHIKLMVDLITLQKPVTTNVESCWVRDKVYT